MATEALGANNAKLLLLLLLFQEKRKPEDVGKIY
jgi:hypothetical protein